MNIFRYFGPSTLVTAAFIGPGTITLCSLTGATTGYSLLWVMLFSVFTAIIFQEMAARLGLITQQGLGEAIHDSSLNSLAKWAMVGISIFAIIIGNAAYEAGNMAGAVLGIELVWGEQNFWPLILGLLAGLILYFGKYKLLEKFLIGLVLLMSACFILTVIMVKPNVVEVAQGFIPATKNFDHVFLIIGLIGTTIVPYNLFLHASSISEKYKEKEQLSFLRKENAVAIILGGLISTCIIITAGTVFTNEQNFNGIGDFALQLEPLLGSYAKIVMALGFFAAGLSSAITAPLAAAYAARGLFKLGSDWKNKWFRIVWMMILVVGVVVSMLGFKPILIIKFAQIANGILLPIIALFLMYVVNSNKIMGSFRNGLYRNLAAGFLFLLLLAISIKTLINVFS